MELWNKKTHEAVEVVGLEIIDGRAFLRIKDSNGTMKCEFRSLKELNEIFSDMEEEFAGFIIDYTNREVRTECGDSYYDYSISFDELDELMKKIKEIY